MDQLVALVDDDTELGELVARHLRSHGFAVRLFQDAESLLVYEASFRHCLYVLDVMLPGMDGISLARTLRDLGNRAPILMLTARTEEADLVMGLELAADDYVAKPVRPRELVARIRALLRRAAGDVVPTAAQTSLQIGSWTFDRIERRLRATDGTVRSLSSLEYKLLELLTRHPGQVLSRDQIMDHLHGREASPIDRSIDLLVSKLRLKLDDQARNPQLIKTVRSEGYVLAISIAKK